MSELNRDMGVSHEQQDSPKKVNAEIGPGLYKVLGLSESATPEEIKSQYRRLARRYHPDVNKEPGAEVKFHELSEAYQCLSDPDKRRQYDNSLKSPRKAVSTKPNREAWGADFYRTLLRNLSRDTDKLAQPENATRKKERPLVSIVEINGKKYLQQGSVKPNSFEILVNGHLEIKIEGNCFIGKDEKGFYPINSSGERMGGGASFGFALPYGTGKDRWVLYLSAGSDEAAVQVADNFSRFRQYRWEGEGQNKFVVLGTGIGGFEKVIDPKTGRTLLPNVIYKNVEPDKNQPGNFMFTGIDGKQYSYSYNA